MAPLLPVLVLLGLGGLAFAAASKDDHTYPNLPPNVSAAVRGALANVGDPTTLRQLAQTLRMAAANEADPARRADYLAAAGALEGKASMIAGPGGAPADPHSAMSDVVATVPGLADHIANNAPPAAPPGITPAVPPFFPTSYPEQPPAPPAPPPWMPPVSMPPAAAPPPVAMPPSMPPWMPPVSLPPVMPPIVAPAMPPPAAAVPFGYVIASGDYLGNIATRFGTSVAAIMAVNPKLTDPAKIAAGATLTLPPGAVDRGSALHATGHITAGPAAVPITLPASPPPVIPVSLPPGIIPPGIIPPGMIPPTLPVALPANLPVLPSPLSMPLLKRGGNNPAAATQLWQQILIAIMNAPIPTTVAAGYGTFGPLSETWTKSFQASHGLTADGIVGPQSWTVGLTAYAARGLGVLRAA